MGVLMSAEKQKQESKIEDLIASRKKNLESLRRKGIEPFPYSFNPTVSSAELREKFNQKLSAGEHSKEKAVIAGRVMARRSFGKLHFLTLQDSKGRIQVSVSQADAEKQSFELVDFIDIGDFIGVDGTVIKTKKGELSVLAKTISFLSKALNPLPEKWHGLTDIEMRYRKRALDLIMNPEVKEVFEKRARIIALIRQFLESKGFLEVEIPLLQPTYGGANARPFLTKSHARKSDFYLSISPELYLKRLIVGGFEKVYTICKNFRNEDVDKTHNPEFTMMECYAAYWDYNDVMKLTEELFEFAAKQLNGTTLINYQGNEIELKAPWKRMTMHNALKKFAKLDVEKLSDSELKKLLAENQLEVEPFKRGLAIADLFQHFCEEHLVQPTFIIDHPKETTPLCKLKRGNPVLIERFEPFINGWEMANAYSELNDPELQEKFFAEQSDQGRAKGETHPLDADFVDALRYGMPPTGGLGIGIDRLVMLLTNQPTIKDVIFFPQMRPEKK
jgi:lysyl-tRNA synthetase class 2